MVDRVTRRGGGLDHRPGHGSGVSGSGRVGEKLCGGCKADE